MSERASNVELISDAYRALNVELMRTREHWGTGGQRFYYLVVELIERFHAKTVLDFGCGRGTLGNAIMGRDKQHAPIAVTWFDYDPAIAGKHTLPAHADLVCCTHVLEHVEPELLPATIRQLGSIARAGLLIAVPHRPSAAVLPDGRNCHLTVKSATWWQAKLKPLGRVERLPPLLTLAGTKRDETRFVVSV